MAKKKIFLLAFIAVALLASISIVYPVRAEGILRVGWSQEPRTLNPMGYDTVQAGMIFRSMLYDTLVTYDKELNPAPMLAKSWNTSEDGLTWSFNLEEGAAWHDGKPLTSEDIAFTYRYILENKIPNFINYLKYIDSIETPDKYTLILKYKEPIASTLFDLCNVFIVAKHKWEQIPGKDAVTYENKSPLGSGPFTFDVWKKNDHMSFKANTNYWRKKPSLNQVIFTFFASPDPMIMSLKKGDIHVIGSELTPLAARVLAKDEKIKVVQSPNLYYRHICINSSSFGKGHPALREDGTP